jgi:integrase
MKGVFTLRPPRPRYEETWDVEIMLTYLRKLAPVKTLSLKNLTMKLVMLLLLTTAQRKQTLLLLDVNNLQMTRSSCVFQLTGLVKTSRPNDPKRTLVVKAYAPDRRLCIMFALREYLLRTKVVRKKESQLFISYQQPCKAVTGQTMSRWILDTMDKAGINTKLFKPHSTRSAVVSKADAKHVPVKDILEKAGWASSRTFAKYYKKKIIIDTFQKAVLGNNSIK